MKQKPAMENFASFNRNRKSKAMAGVATLVHTNFKDDFMKVTEGENDDALQPISPA
jgi:hypothetical protein